MNLRTKLLCAAAAILTAGLAAQAQVPSVNSSLNTVFTLVYDASTMKPTYSASAAPFAVANNATDVCSLNGSASKTLKVRRVFFNMIATTAVTDPVAILKRSTANAGGTSLALTNVAYDSTNPTAAGFADIFTGNPTTLGTLVGVLADLQFSVGNLTTGGAQTPQQPFYQAGVGGSPIVLRGAAQTLAISLNAGSFPGGLASCTFEWTEE